MIPTIFTERMAEPSAQINGQLSRLGSRVREVSSLNVESGEVEADERAILGAFTEALGAEQGGPWGEEYIQLLGDGFAVLAIPEQGPPVVFPWHLLIAPAWPQVLSPRLLLSTFGIGPGGTPTAAREVMTHRFPNVPAAVVDERNLEYLGQVSLLRFIGNPVGLWKEEIDAFEGATTVTILPGGGSTTPGASSGNAFVDAVNQAVACIKNVTVNAHWWGVEVCFDNTCGNIVANALLMGAGGGGPVAAALNALVGGTAGTIEAAVDAAGGIAAFALAAISFYTGASMLANITAKGVCLQALWPITGGFIWWAAGR
jgi:hypothetical protein